LKYIKSVFKIKEIKKERGLRNVKVKLIEIIRAIEGSDINTDYYYNSKNNKVFFSGTYGNSFDLNNELNEDELDALYSESIPLPSHFDINEYQIMKDFIETIDDLLLYKQLLIAINGQGAFRRFKDTCINFNIIDKWYEFQNKRYEEIALKWCQNNKIEYE